MTSSYTMKDSRWTLPTVVGVVMNILCLGAIIASFVTSHWTVYTINRGQLSLIFTDNATLREALQNNVIYYSQHGGLLQICYKDLPQKLVDDRQGSCVTETGYEVGDPTEYWESDIYRVRAHLLRTQFIVMVISMIFCLVAGVVAIVAYLKESYNILKAAGFLAVVCAITMAVAMLVFQGRDFIEKQKIESIASFPASWKNWNTDLHNNSTLGYGYSYIVGWVSLVLAVIFCIIYLYASTTMHKIENDNKSLLPTKHFSPYMYAGSKGKSSSKKKQKTSKGRRESVLKPYDYEGRRPSEPRRQSNARRPSEARRQSEIRRPSEMPRSSKDHYLPSINIDTPRRDSHVHTRRDSEQMPGANTFPPSRRDSYPIPPEAMARKFSNVLSIPNSRKSDSDSYYSNPSSRNRSYSITGQDDFQFSEDIFSNTS